MRASLIASGSSFHFPVDRQNAKTIVYLIGYAGTGKYSIAKELAALTGAVLVDNHLRSATG